MTQKLRAIGPMLSSQQLLVVADGVGASSEGFEAAVDDASRASPGVLRRASVFESGGLILGALTFDRTTSRRIRLRLLQSVEQRSGVTLRRPEASHRDAVFVPPTRAGIAMAFPTYPLPPLGEYLEALLGAVDDEPLDPLLATCPFGSWEPSDVRDAVESLIELSANGFDVAAVLRRSGSNGEEDDRRMSLHISNLLGSRVWLVWDLSDGDQRDALLSDALADAMAQLPAMAYGFVGVSPRLGSRWFEPRPAQVATFQYVPPELDDDVPASLSDLSEYIDGFVLDAFPWQKLSSDHLASFVPRPSSGVPGVEIEAMGTSLTVRIGHPTEWIAAATDDDPAAFRSLLRAARDVLRPLILPRGDRRRLGAEQRTRRSSAVGVSDPRVWA